MFFSRIIVGPQKHILNVAWSAGNWGKRDGIMEPKIKIMKWNQVKKNFFSRISSQILFIKNGENGEQLLSAQKYVNGGQG